MRRLGLLGRLGLYGEAGSDGSPVVVLVDSDKLDFNAMAGIMG